MKRKEAYKSPPSIQMRPSTAAAAMAGLGFRCRAGQVLSSYMKVRSFGAAAAAQLQCDYEDAYPNSMVDDSEGSEPTRGVQWVVMGEPAANVHVHFYAQWLSQLLHVPLISLSTLVRHHLHPPSPLFKQIENTVSRGMLVPEDVIFGLLSKRLMEGCSRGETGFMLDGIPRTTKQAGILDQIVDIDLVLNLKVTDRKLVENTLHNGLNSKLQGSQIKLFSNKVDGKEKLCTYAHQSKPLEDYYRKQKKLVDFQIAEGLGERETWKGLLSVLHLESMDSSLQKLNA